ncbi:MAG: response regulator [Bacilli bacterium]|nr:response regulator [Bacilli bacterium]
MNIIVVDDEVSSLSLFLNQVVDDEAVNCRFFRDNPGAILDYCKNHDVKGAFVDINMHNIQGDALAAMLIKENPDMQIVFVTGTNTTMDDLSEEVREHTVEILYKPLDSMALKRRLLLMGNRPVKLSVRTFGAFDCFIDKRPVRFSSNKSKELFALLIVENGKTLSMDRAISMLWPDKDLSKAKILYRDAVWRLRKTLEDANFQCVDFLRASLSLNKDDIQCDYYDLLDGKDVYYTGEFLSSYDWSYPYESEIDYLLEKRKGRR